MKCSLLDKICVCVCVLSLTHAATCVWQTIDLAQLTLRPVQSAVQTFKLRNELKTKEDFVKENVNAACRHIDIYILCPNNLSFFHILYVVNMLEHLSITRDIYE